MSLMALTPMLANSRFYQNTTTGDQKITVLVHNHAVGPMHIRIELINPGAPPPALIAPPIPPGGIVAYGILVPGGWQLHNDVPGMFQVLDVR